MVLEKYAERFHAMVEDLSRHPDIIITHFHQGPPASQHDIEAAEILAGRTLPESLKMFYQQSDGLSLSWAVKSRVPASVADQYQPVIVRDFGENNWDSLDNDHFMRDYDNILDGVVNIPDIQSLFQQDWEDIVWSYDDSDEGDIKIHGYDFSCPLEQRQSIIPFDGFSKEWCTSLLWKRDEQYNGMEIPLVLGSGSHADYSNTRPTSIETYLEFILAQKGLVTARQYYFGFALDGTQQTPFEQKQLEEANVPPRTPKKPMSSFFLFVQEHRGRVRQEHPELSFGDLTRRVGEMFKDLSVEEKKKWDDQARQDRQRYEDEKLAYDQRRQVALREMEIDPSNSWFCPKDNVLFWANDDNQLDVDVYIQTRIALKVG